MHPRRRRREARPSAVPEAQEAHRKHGVRVHEGVDGPPDNPSMKGTGKDIADELRGSALFTALDPHQLQFLIDSTRVCRLAPRPREPQPSRAQAERGRQHQQGGATPPCPADRR